MGRIAEAGISLICAVYLRVSSDLQDVENSKDRQLRACREWAARNDATIPEHLIFVDEARSATSTIARPAFQRILDAVRRRGAVPFDVLLVDDDSRLDRGGKLAELTEVFQSRGVKLIVADSGRDITSDDERLLVHVKSGLNEQYIRELSRRTRNGIAARVLHGFHSGGKVYGYRLVPLWPEGLAPERRDRKARIGTKVEIDPAEAAIVLRVFKAYARGEGLRAISLALHDDGVRSSRGREWWDISAVRDVLLNAKYAGDWSWNRGRFQKVPESLLTDAERERARERGTHPRRRAARVGEVVTRHAEELRIVPDDLWRAVHARFSERVGDPERGRASRRTKSPIAALLKCACGSWIACTSTKARGYHYRRMGCAWHRTRGGSVCSNDVLPRAEVVEAAILAVVRDELLNPARVGRALALLREKLSARRRASAKPEAKIAALRKEAARLETEIANVVDAIAAAPASHALAAALAAREARLAAVRAEVEALAAPTAPDAIPNVDERQVRARLAAIGEDLKRLDSDRARAALARMFGPITVEPLDGSWKNGWDLRIQAHPAGAIGPVVATLEIPGPNSNVGTTVFRARVPRGSRGGPRFPRRAA